MLRSSLSTIILIDLQRGHELAKGHVSRAAVYFKEALKLFCQCYAIASKLFLECLIGIQTTIPTCISLTYILGAFREIHPLPRLCSGGRGWNCCVRVIASCAVLLLRKYRGLCSRLLRSRLARLAMSQEALVVDITIVGDDAILHDVLYLWLSIPQSKGSQRL